MVSGWVARFVCHTSLLREGAKMVHWRAFLETREGNESELSVDYHKAFAQDINWKGGEVVNPACPVIGAADFKASELPEELYLEPDPIEGFTTHAEIKGWKTGEENKSWRITKCKALARIAQYVPKVDDGLVV